VEADALAALPEISLRRHRWPSRLVHGTAALAGRPRLDRLLGAAPDVVWLPAPAPVAVSPGVPLVLTIHDLSFEQRPGDFTAYERAWHRLARPAALARRARAVIVPSPPVRDLVLTRWGVAEERVSVIPEGVRVPARDGSAAALRELGLPPGGYLLAVGALEPRKAPEVLVEAFDRARRGGLRLELVLAGEGRLARRLSAPGVRLVGLVGDATLDMLYRGAVALVSASLLEGYGLPVREALARGTPAIVSDLPVFGPDLDGALVRFAPGDAAALADAMLAVGTEPELRDRLASAARSAVAELTWEAAAVRTRAVLQSAAAGG
jgi:glycosyltransferase involved in cell wall biosynthesis